MREWLKKARDKSGFTMAQMAEKLDITESYYSMIEAGTRQSRMDISLAAKISGILGIPITQIVEADIPQE